jgi:hypothetical protein
LFDPHLARSYNQLVLSALSLPAGSILWNRVIEVKGERASDEFYEALHRADAGHGRKVAIVHLRPDDFLD